MENGKGKLLEKYKDVKNTTHVRGRNSKFEKRCLNSEMMYLAVVFVVLMMRAQRNFLFKP